MKWTSWLGLSLILVAASTQSSELSIEDYKHNELSPLSGGKIDIVIFVPDDGLLTVRIESPDRDVVSTLVAKKAVKKGAATVTWFGRDDSDVPVPNEAYVPVLTLEAQDGKTYTLNSRDTSGGEVVSGIDVRFDESMNMSFDLPAPSRVLGRAGVKSGAMLRSLSDWGPRNTGSNIIIWDGYDESHVDKISRHPKFATMITAYQLPKHAIIVIGSDEVSYPDYRRSRGWPETREKRRVLARSRAGVPLSAAFFDAKYNIVSPRVSMEFENVNESEAGVPIFADPVIIKVDVPKNERWGLEQSLFEVAFFIDYEFHSEEEQGYVPFVWKFDPASLEPGRHILTVNISGFDGQVGVASSEFIVP